MAEKIIQCPHCKQQLNLDEEYIGMEVECPVCNAAFVAEEYDPKPNTPPRAIIVEDETPEQINTPDEIIKITKLNRYLGILLLVNILLNPICIAVAKIPILGPGLSIIIPLIMYVALVIMIVNISKKLKLNIFLIIAYCVITIIPLLGLGVLVDINRKIEVLKLSSLQL